MRISASPTKKGPDIGGSDAIWSMVNTGPGFIAHAPQFIFFVLDVGLMKLKAELTGCHQAS